MCFRNGLIIEKMMFPPFLGCFHSILFKLADNEDKHKLSDEFEFRPDRTTAFEGLKISHRPIMGKWCLHATSSFIFDRIIIKVAGNQVRHKSLDEFDFGLDQPTPFGVICPCVTKISPI